MDSDGNSYKIELTVFNSNTNSTIKSKNACEATA